MARKYAWEAIRHDVEHHLGRDWDQLDWFLMQGPSLRSDFVQNRSVHNYRLIVSLDEALKDSVKENQRIFIQPDVIAQAIISYGGGVEDLPHHTQRILFNWRDVFRGYWEYIRPKLNRFLMAGWDAGVPGASKMGSPSMGYDHYLHLIHLLDTKAEEITVADIAYGIQACANMKQPLHPRIVERLIDWSIDNSFREEIIVSRVMDYMGTEWALSSTEWALPGTVRLREANPMDSVAIPANFYTDVQEEQLFDPDVPLENLYD
ncbi:hypothetical protein GGS21DRAFT_417621 [Xylaria nigripes]|nr:hypothetical protein GGS21DRAFT_417621 [Xylaria nigripes]